MNVIQYFNSLAAADVIRTGQVLLIPEPTLADGQPARPAPSGHTASPQLGGPIKR